MDTLAETDWPKSETKVGLKRKMSEPGYLSKMTQKSKFSRVLGQGVGGMGAAL